MGGRTVPGAAAGHHCCGDLRFGLIVAEATPLDGPSWAALGPRHPDAAPSG